MFSLAFLSFAVFCAAQTSSKAATTKATTKAGTTAPATTVFVPPLTPQKIVPEDFDELYVSDGDNGIVWVSTAKRGTTDFSKPVKLVEGLVNPQGLALCGKGSQPQFGGVPIGGKGGLKPYLIVADKGSDSKPGYVYRITLQRENGKITMGSKEPLYGESTPKTREPTDVACDDEYLYIADAKKGKIKRVKTDDYKGQCGNSNSKCDGDDWVGDECEGAVNEVKSLAMDKEYVYWTTQDEDNNSAGIWRMKKTVKEAKCALCKGGVQEDLIPTSCKDGVEDEPAFHKPTSDGLYGVAVMDDKVFYTKGEDTVKYVSTKPDFPDGPDSEVFSEGFGKITYIIPYSSVDKLIGCDKDKDRVMLFKKRCTLCTKTKLVEVDSANGVAFAAGLGQYPTPAPTYTPSPPTPPTPKPPTPPPTPRRTRSSAGAVVFSVAIALIATIALL